MPPVQSTTCLLNSWVKSTLLWQQPELEPWSIKDWTVREPGHCLNKVSLTQTSFKNFKYRKQKLHRGFCHYIQQKLTFETVQSAIKYLWFCYLRTDVFSFKELCGPMWTAKASIIQVWLHMTDTQNIYIYERNHRSSCNIRYTDISHLISNTRLENKYKWNKKIKSNHSQMLK